MSSNINTRTNNITRLTQQTASALSRTPTRTTNLTRLIDGAEVESHRTVLDTALARRSDAPTRTYTATELLRDAGPTSQVRQAPALDHWLALDVSWSMSEAYSGARSKLEAAGLAAQTLILERENTSPGSSLGIITFNTYAAVLEPMSPIRSRKRELIRSARSLTADGGTNLKRALKCAREQSDCAVEVTLLTDGHGGDPTRLADEMKADGCVIHCIGVGSSPRQVCETTLKRAASQIDGIPSYVFAKDMKTLTKTVTSIAITSNARANS